MKKILLTEDDAFLIKVLGAKLAKAGYEVKTATNGEEALELLKQFNPDLILMDLVMPKKDGFDTLKEIKSNDSLKKIPVIITTNLGQLDDKDRAMKLGAADYLVKSDSSLNAVIEKIKDYLK
jgi:two-component system alkaline phosphatase synthesis response regulator PhoP